MTDREAERANRADWDTEADSYQQEHGEFLGDARFVWGPEGLDEEQIRILGDVRGLRVLDLGCGAAQCARWLRTQGALAVGVDLSWRQLQHARRIDEETSIPVPTVCGSALALPFADAPSTWSRPRSGRFRSWSTSRTRCARSDGCSSQAHGPRSPSSTRCAGCSPTTRPRPG